MRTWVVSPAMVPQFRRTSVVFRRGGRAGLRHASDRGGRLRGLMLAGVVSLTIWAVVAAFIFA